jgi:DNA-binding NtrC family response regulator
VQALLVDSNDSRRARIAAALSEAGVDMLPVATAPVAAGSAIKAIDLALVALDASTPDLVERFRRADPLLPVVVYAPQRLDAATASALGRVRVFDCLVLDERTNLAGLLPRLQDAAQRKAARRREHAVAHELLGRSEKMAQVKRYIDRAAHSEANVLITGESGTGKELVAHAIHRHSARASGPFVAVNCSAIPDALLESDLFGHEKGSFTGAIARTRGRFEQADGGTLFFDEIGEMPAALQAKLLRVLQPPPGASETTREYTRVGSEEPARADVRLIFATHRELTEQVEGRRFREDLFQRIHVLVIRVPPLRERREDIPMLARHFLHHHAALEGQANLEFDPLVLDVLQAYDYPLNVRELEGIVRSLVILKDAGSTVVLGDLPPHLFAIPAARGGNGSTAAALPALRLRTLEEVELEHVHYVLDECGGNKSRAARILGISRPALDRKLNRTPGGPDPEPPPPEEEAAP